MVTVNSYPNQKMSEITNTDKVLNFLEKWILFILVLSLYFFLSYKILHILAGINPSDNECGTGFFATFVVHVFLAVIALVVLGLKMFLGNGYNIWVKLIVFVLIIVPPVISYNLFF